MRWQQFPGTQKGAPECGTGQTLGRIQKDRIFACQDKKIGTASEIIKSDNVNAEEKLKIKIKKIEENRNQ